MANWWEAAPLAKSQDHTRVDAQHRALSEEQKRALIRAKARRLSQEETGKSDRLGSGSSEELQHGNVGPWNKHQQQAIEAARQRREAGDDGPWKKYKSASAVTPEEARAELARRRAARGENRQIEVAASGGRTFSASAPDAGQAVDAVRGHIANAGGDGRQPLHPEFDPANLPAAQARSPSRLTAALSSAVDGIPVAGPYLQSGVEHVASGIGSLISDRPRSEVLAEMRGMVDQAQDTYPWTSTAASVGGAVAGTLPMILAAPGAFGASGGPLWARTLASGASGAGIGGADSAVRSDGDADATKWGTAAGAATGLAGPVMGRLVGAGWQGLRDYRALRAAEKASGFDRETLSRISRGIRDDGYDAATARQRLQELGPQGMLADLGPNMQQQAGALAATPGRGQEIIRSSITQRQRGAGDRISSSLDDALGQPADTLAVADDIVTRRAAAARPLYQRAYQDGSRGVWSPELQRMASSPMFADAMRGAATRGQDRAVLDGFGAFNPRVSITQDGRIVFNQKQPGGSPLYPDLQYWDYVKRELDDIAGAAARAGKREEASIATNLASRLRTELDAAVPSYRSAREAYSGPSAILDALEEGQNVFRNSTTPGQLRRQMGAMGEAERDAFIQGARAQIAQIMGTARNDAQAARALFERGFNRDKLQILLGDAEAKQLLRSLEAETTFAATRDVVTRNSLTASRQEAMKDITGNSPPQFGVREGYMSGGFMGAARSSGIRALEGLRDVVTKAHREARNTGLAKAVSSQDYDGIIEALMASQSVRRVNQDSIERIARALLVGGGTAAARP
jgi:hypothetical protein